MQTPWNSVQAFSAYLFNTLPKEKIMKVRIPFCGSWLAGFFVCSKNGLTPQWILEFVVQLYFSYWKTN